MAHPDVAATPPKAGRLQVARGRGHRPMTFSHPMPQRLRWGRAYATPLRRPELVHQGDSVGRLLPTGVALDALPLLDVVAAVAPHDRLGGADRLRQGQLVRMVDHLVAHQIA